MAALSIQTLQRIADDTGHQAGTLEKVLRPLDILQETAGDTILSERLALKGGTALNVFHLGLDRLSVDIDLNYVGALERSAMEAERPEVEAALNRLLASQGYVIRHGRTCSERQRPHAIKHPRFVLPPLRRGLTDWKPLSLTLKH